MSLLSDLENKSGRIGWPWNEETSPSIYDLWKNWPRITIITPSYNQGQYIEETIRSVLLQNYPNLEFMIIDGGSTDDTLSIIKQYEPYLTYWVSEKDEGQSDAINKGFRRTGGDLVNWINSDDMLCRDALFHIGKTYIEYRPDLINGTGYILEGGTLTYRAKNRSLNELIFQGKVFHQPCLFIATAPNREELHVDPSLHYRMDPELHIRLMMKSRSLINIPAPIGITRWHREMKTQAESLNKIRREQRKITVRHAAAVLKKLLGRKRH